MISLFRSTQDIYNLGLKREEYLSKSSETQSFLRKIRQSPYYEKADERQLIEQLVELEKRNLNATQQTALDLSRRTVQSCVGPTAGFTAKVAAETIKKQLNGSTDNLSTDLASSFIETTEKEATNQTINGLLSKSTEWGSEILGTSVIAGALSMAPVATAALATTGALACATNPALREKCWGYITGTFRGAEALISGAAEQIFAKENQNKLIIDAYNLYDQKRVKRLETISLRKSEKRKRQETQNSQNDVLNNLQAVNNTLKKRYSKILGRFVRCLRSYFLSRKLILPLLCVIFNCFRRENSIQKKLNAEIISHNQKLTEIKVEINNHDKAISVLSVKISKKTTRVNNLEKAYIQALG